ncbi:hypothetical protein ACGFK1_03770 [Mycobacterium sp. NPDC048908]|uniref:hypothetical protein n=1 Tax=Mycobacterium sp. NPDC048908 TaxID=3364292 RepID=UPI003719B1C7
MTSPKAALWPRLLQAALIAAAAILGGSAVGHPAIGCAAPAGSAASYDECVSRGSNERLCCSLAGGDWRETRYYDKNGKYLYSSWDCAGLALQQGRPTMPPEVVTHTLEPAAPSVRNPGVIEPFTAAPMASVG